MRYLFLPLLLSLVACDEGADIALTEPLPVGSTDLTAFVPRHRGIYVEPADTSMQLEVLPTLVRRRFWITDGPFHWRQLDSVRQDIHGAPPLAVCTDPIGADSFRLRVLAADTIFRLGRPTEARLRFKGGSYYLNEPADTLGVWHARRLELHGRQARLYVFSDDTVRLRQRGQVRIVPRKRPLYIVNTPTGKGVLRDTTYWRPASSELFEWRRPSSQR